MFFLPLLIHALFLFSPSPFLLKNSGSYTFCIEIISGILTTRIIRDQTRVTEVESKLKRKMTDRTFFKIPSGRFVVVPLILEIMNLQFTFNIKYVIENKRSVQNTRLLKERHPTGHRNHHSPSSIFLPNAFIT